MRGLGARGGVAGGGGANAAAATTTAAAANQLRALRLPTCQASAAGTAAAPESPGRSLQRAAYAHLLPSALPPAPPPQPATRPQPQRQPLWPEPPVQQHHHHKQHQQQHVQEPFTQQQQHHTRQQQHHHKQHQHQQHTEQQQPKAPDTAAAAAGADAPSTAQDRIAASARLMSDIRAASTVAQLAALFDGQADAFDHVHVASMLGRLPHARDLAYSQWPALGPEGQRLLTQLLQRFLSDLPRHRARQTSNALWAVGRLARDAARDGATAAAAATLARRLLLDRGALLLRPGGANAADAANTAWAMARLQVAWQAAERQADTGSCSGGVADDQEGPETLSAAAAATATSGPDTQSLPLPWLDQHAWAVLEDACARQLPHCSPRELCSMLWAFAAARRPAPRLFAAAAPHVLRVGLRLDATHISGIAWAYAKQGWRCDGASSPSSNSSSSSRGSGGDSSSSSSSSGTEADVANRVFACLSLRATVNAPRFRSQALAVTLWALATAGYRGDAAGPAALAAVSELRLRKFSGQGLAMLARAAAALGMFEQRPGLMGVLQREVLFKLEELRPLGVAWVLQAVVQSRRPRSSGGGGAGGSAGPAAAAAQRRAAREVQQQLEGASRRGSRGAVAGATAAGSGVALPQHEQREEKEQEQEEEQQQHWRGQAAGEDAAAAAAAAVIDAVAAVAATDGLPSAEALARRGEPPCQRLFMREVLRRAETVLLDTAPETLRLLVVSLAALRESEPRLLRAAAAAAARHARGGGGGTGAYTNPWAAAQLLAAFAALQQPCVELWTELSCILIAGAGDGCEGASIGASSPGDEAAAAGHMPLSPDQLVTAAWAAAASPGAAAAPQPRAAMRALLLAAWAHASALDAGALARLAWASAVWLSHAHADTAADAIGAADAVAARLARALPPLLTAAAAAPDATTGAAFPLSNPERRAELLQAASLLAAHGGAAATAGASFEGLTRAARRLAEATFDSLGARPLPPRALLLLLRCHAGSSEGSSRGDAQHAQHVLLRDPMMAQVYASEALTHIRSFPLQTALDTLSLLASAPGGPSAAAGRPGSELAAAAAAALRARLPAAAGPQLAAAAAAGAAAQGAGGGLARAAGKLLLSRTGECAPADLLSAAGALAAASGAGLGRGGAADALPLVSRLLAAAAARLGPVSSDGDGGAFGGAAAAIAAARRAAAVLESGPAAAAGGGSSAAALRACIQEAIAGAAMAQQ